MDDRREHPRADVSATAVVLVRHNDGVAMTIESLSIGGARLAGSLTVENGERVQILLEIGGHPIEIHGDVVRVERRDMSTDCISVRFVELADDVRERIAALVGRTLDGS